MLRLGKREFGPHEPVIMAIVNRTPDSFYDQGATYQDEPALARVERAVASGLVSREGRTIRLTRRGFLLADTVFEGILAG